MLAFEAYSMTTRKDLVARLNDLRPAVYDEDIDNKHYALSRLRDLKDSLYLDGNVVKSSSNFSLTSDIEQSLTLSLNDALSRRRSASSAFQYDSRRRHVSNLLRNVYSK